MSERFVRAESSWLLVEEGIWKHNEGYEIAAKLIGDKDRVVFHGGIFDDGLGYEFDVTDILEYEGQFFLAKTAGCSCPSYSEMGSVHGPYSLPELRHEIESEYQPDYYEGYRSALLGIVSEIEQDQL